MSSRPAGHDSFEYHVAEIAVLLLFSLPAFWALSRALHGKPVRSLRFAYLSLFAGLLFLLQVERSFGLNSAVTIRRVNQIRATISILGLVLAVKAFRLRREDQGTGRLRPSIGAVLCGIHLVCAVSMLINPPVLPAGAEGEGWIYRSEADGYSITLPNRQWAQGQMERASSDFRCSALPVRIAVHVRSEPREAYGTAIQRFKETEFPTLRDGRWETGRTSEGYDFFLAEGFEEKPTGSIFVTMCTVYRPKPTQMVTFVGEAIPNRTSQAERESEIAAVKGALRSIIFSLK